MLADDERDRRRFEAERAEFILRKIAHYGGNDLRPEWQAGALTLAELEDTLSAISVENAAMPVSTKSKGKGKAADIDEESTSNYPAVSCSLCMVCFSANIMRQISFGQAAPLNPQPAKNRKSKAGHFQ